jgi:Protein of unknown function (DUF3887)
MFEESFEELCMKKSIPAFLLSVGLLGGILPAVVQQPVVAATMTIAQANDHQAIAQQFITNLSSGDFAAALQMYDSAVRPNLTPESLQQNWQDLTAEAGDFQEVVSTRTVEADDTGTSSVVIATCQFANGSRDLYVTFTDANLVSEFTATEAQ